MNQNKNTKRPSDAVLVVSSICNCSPEYVRKVLNGAREVNSDKSQIILLTYNKYVEEYGKVIKIIRSIPKKYREQKNKMINQLVNT